ncbi:M12 family metallopeptidase [Cellulophaga baltica]|uniref:M12 family metallopeptidase n=1 Tax=Cellulophaga baltica TaxID=76594 RepID=UPI0021496634|nr:M12 family metallopeptidase [Cellulophaga baltica]MCR1024512.1 M12 family metallopeptidase [Cellulophaga baltica]
MVKKSKTLTIQVRELAERIDLLEATIEKKTKPKTRYDNSKDGNHFCCLPKVPERQFEEAVSPTRERLIRLIDKKWVNGTKLRYYIFKEGQFSGPASNVNLVKDGFKVWEDVGIGLSFEEVNDISEAELRIGFLQDGFSWSYVGRDNIDIPGQFERTMNFGWDLTLDPRGVDTPVHEIGHALGFPHEHQNPNSGIVWDEEAVYEYFGGPPNNWLPEDTYNNVLRKLPRSAVDGSDWDPNSVMHYGFGPGLIISPPEYAEGITPELGLSATDTLEVKHFYPPIPSAQYPELIPFGFKMLSLEPAQQSNYSVQPNATRTYTIQTFGSSDTVIVLFEEVDGELRFLAGDDDSGSSLNSKIEQRLYPDRKYVLRIRLYSQYSSGDTGVMMW